MPPPTPGGFRAPPPPAPGSYGYGQPAYGAPGYEYGSQQPRLASYGYRVGGYIIDGVLLGIVFLIIVLLSHGIHTQAATATTQKRVHIDVGLLLVEPLITLLYATLLCGGKAGQTVGMRLVGIRVVKAADGSQVGYGKAFVRAIVAEIFAALASLTIIAGLLVLLDLLWPLWDKQNQTLHDKVASTVVIKT
jgi:uncharacterized RDD family membrane protein YckC